MADWPLDMVEQERKAAEAAQAGLQLAAERAEKAQEGMSDADAYKGIATVVGVPLVTAALGCAAFNRIAG